MFVRGRLVCDEHLDIPNCYNLTRPVGLSNPSPVQKQVLNRLTVCAAGQKIKYDHLKYFVETFFDSAEMSNMDSIFCALQKGRDKWIEMANIILGRITLTSGQGAAHS